MIKRLFLIGFLLLTGVLLSACMPGQTQKSPGVGLANHWQLKAYPDSHYTKPDTQHITLSFSAKTGQVSGYSGCNRYIGHYQVTQQHLSLNPLASTRRLCLNSQDETRFLSRLSKANYFQIKNRQLTLQLDDQALLIFSLVQTPLEQPIGDSRPKAIP